MVILYLIAYIIFKPRSIADENKAGTDPGFLEKGFRCVKEWGRFADFISFFLNIP